MNNFEKIIKPMTEQEFFEHLYFAHSGLCNLCSHHPLSCKYFRENHAANIGNADCQNGIREWLQTERNISKPTKLTELAGR